MQRTLQIRTGKKFEVVDLTTRVAAVVAQAGVAEGFPCRPAGCSWECDGPREREVVIDLRG